METIDNLEDIENIENIGYIENIENVEYICRCIAIDPWTSKIDIAAPPTTATTATCHTRDMSHVVTPDC